MTRTVSQENLLSVVVPLLNEESNIRVLYERVRAAIDDIGDIDYEFVFVDDGSSDGSWEIIQLLNAEDSCVRAVRLSRNFGHQQALRAGISAAQGNAVVMMDCDLQHPPEMLPQLVEKWREGYSVVNAVKTDNADQGPFMKLLVLCAYKMLNFLSKHEVTPGASDFRLIDRTVVDGINRLNETNLLLRSIVGWFGAPTCIITYVAEARHSGEPKYRFRSLAYLFIAGLFTASTRPLRIASLSGMVASVGAAAYGIYLVGLKLFGTINIPGWTASMIVDIFFGGLILVVLGAIGEYVALIYEEIRNRPNYLVQETIS